MNLRHVFILGSTAACLAAATLVVIRQRQIAGLRNQQQSLAFQTRRATTGAVSSGAGGALVASQTSHSPSVELLRLRNQVTQLGNRKRELAGVRTENDQLRSQLAASQTNAAAAAGLPPGYTLRSRARLAGFATPEDTLESFLWAVQNKDFATLQQTLAPEPAAELQAQVQHRKTAIEEIFRIAEVVPGLRVLSRHPQPDGSLELRVEFIPGLPDKPRIRMRQSGGQWKLADLP